MSPEERNPPRIRRMLPSVSEVLKELTARAPVEPDVAFRAAREVCAEELKRIRDAGGDSVPLEELVQRALLRVTGGRPPATPVPPSAPQVLAPAPPRPGEVFDGSPEPSFALGAAAGDDPFSETTGAMDLRWDPDPHEPFADSGPAVPISAEAPTAVEMSAVPPGPGKFRSGTAANATVPFALPAEADVFEGAVHAAEAPTAILPPEPVPEEGPGDETLTRLSREAQSIDLQSVFPKPSPAVPARLEVPGPAEDEEEQGAEQAPSPFEDDEDTVLTIPRGGRRRAKEGRPRIGLLVGVAASLVALAGLGYLLVGLWVEREDSPAQVAVTRPRPQATPAPLATPAAVPSPEAGERPAAALEATPAPVVPPAGVVTATPAPDRAPARPTPSPPEPALVTPVPAGPAPAAATAPRTRDGLVVTKDREGQPLVFSIHFTSYRDRASAEKDLKRIEGIVGREGFVAEVDLGEKGVWQRVMIGAFPTAQEARAAREELAAKGTRDMGWVYRVIGPEAPDPR